MLALLLLIYFASAVIPSYDGNFVCAFVYVSSSIFLVLILLKLTSMNVQLSCSCFLPCIATW